MEIDNDQICVFYLFLTGGTNVLFFKTTQYDYPASEFQSYNFTFKCQALPGTLT